ncbi:MAG: DUF4287 domain-containing protein [Chloroflexi bacterium HGW-Chloroflexi-4]|jgi:predicted transport protein|nr:MAG: DUF4287 domain-containing protein [Chloroflexi bacterium HGW-Chloroflexi-4]
MDSVNKARETQLANIQNKTGKNLDQVRTIISESGLTKHGEIRQMLIDKLGLGFGDATQLVHFAQNSDGQSAAEAAGLSMPEILIEIYSDAKIGLKPIHEKLIAEMDKFGTYTATPKKGYISYRQKRQFAMIGPGTKGRLEIGLNMKGLEGTDRLLLQTNNLMCQYKVFISNMDEIDAELINWLQVA